MTSAAYPYDQEDTCLEQPQASGMDSVSGSESWSLSPVLSSCSSRAASSAATDDDYEDDAELAEQLQAYFDRDSDLTDDEETHYRWLLYVVAGQ